MSKRFVAAFFAFVLFLTGCANQLTPTSPPTATASPTRESLEGRFTHETMDQYVAAVLPMVKDWLAATWPDLSPPRVMYVPSGTTGPEECADRSGGQGQATSRSYEYCPLDNTVYIGQDQLWEFYQETGSAGPAVGLAHEFGHYVQHHRDVPLPQSNPDSVRFENQADCLAGAWTSYVDALGMIEYPTDITNIEALMRRIGDSEGPDQNHGTVEQREAAFVTGFNGGPPACGIPH